MIRGLVIGFIIGLCLSAQAAHLRRDPLIAMFERRLGAMANIEIRPGVTLTLMDCQCTIKYDGVKVSGRHYDVGFDKLD